MMPYMHLQARLLAELAYQIRANSIFLLCQLSIVYPMII